MAAAAIISLLKQDAADTVWHRTVVPGRTKLRFEVQGRERCHLRVHFVCQKPRAGNDVLKFYKP
jgi:uncharacterized protein YPO0396